MLPVIVFGAALHADGSPRPALRARIRAAAAFGARRQDVFYLVTGGVPRSGRTEAEVMRRLLVESGVVETAIRMEDRSADTCDSVIACSQMLRGNGHAGPVAVVTSDFHIMRCCAMLHALGWATIAVPAPSRSDISRSRWVWVRAREYPAMVWDVFLVLLWRLKGKG